MQDDQLIEKDETRLTQFSKGAGCGCKIAPSQLQSILESSSVPFISPGLIVGNSDNDDAAVYDLGDGKALISTTDFFMPVVDDPFDFGRIAAANAISDVYAMGGKPLMAIAILGWPLEKLPASVAQKVLEGGRNICSEAGIPLAGGHTVESQEPIFGLAVTGIVQVKNLKKNNSAREGDLIFMTKPIGTGILSTAQKRGEIQNEHLEKLVSQMCALNKIGEIFGRHDYVSAMTDITGFGLLGHVIEMAKGAGLTAEIAYSKIPVIEGAREYLTKRIVPDATFRNWNSYSAQTGFEKGVNVMEAFSILPDPQTNGGLLIAADPSHEADIRRLFIDNGLAEFSHPIGRFTSRQDKTIKVLV